MSIDALIERMEALLGPLQEARDARRFFHATYLRTTRAVRDALRAGLFGDSEWVERWDVAFADWYLDALTADSSGGAVSQPWAVAFRAAREQPSAPALRHVLLGMNAHINYDLPQALLAVISPGEFADPAVLARRRADHQRIDQVLSRQVSAEDAVLARAGAPRSRTDVLLGPANQAASRRFLRESRAKVWHNAVALNAARARGPAAYAGRLRELEVLSAARVAELERPGQVLLRLASRGFGVRLPGPGPVEPSPAGPAARSPAGPQPSSRPSRLRSFDPVRVADLEFRAWVGYYRRDWPVVLRASVGLVRAGFGMDWLRTLHGAWLVLRANQLWAPADNNPDGARRCMRRFYGLLRISYGEPRDVAEAARREVDWWRVHRERQHAADYADGDDELVDSLVRLYTFLYGEPEAAVRPAAVHRTEAMDLSDQWVAEGCPPGSPLLALEHAALVRSYAALLAAVHH
jgi:hypothetical protein